MSVLVTCRGLRCAPDPDLVRCPVVSLRLPADYLSALATWGISDVDSYEALVAFRARTWCDHVADAIADPARRASLVHSLGELALSCDELAIWYAGFPDEIPIVNSPTGFESLIDAQLAAGEWEPSGRCVR